MLILHEFLFSCQESQNKNETEGLVQDLNRKDLPQCKRTETVHYGAW